MIGIIRTNLFWRFIPLFRLLFNYYDKGLLFIKEAGLVFRTIRTRYVMRMYLMCLSPALTITSEILLSVLILGDFACMNVYVAITEILFLPLVILYQMKVGGKLQKAGRGQ